MLEWRLDMASQREIRTEGLFAALNDCLYRAMYTFSHVALIDLDEIIMPRHHDNIQQFIRYGTPLLHLMYVRWATFEKLFSSHSFDVFTYSGQIVRLPNVINKLIIQKREFFYLRICSPFQNDISLDSLTSPTRESKSCGDSPIRKEGCVPVTVPDRESQKSLKIISISVKVDEISFAAR